MITEKSDLDTQLRLSPGPARNEESMPLSEDDQRKLDQIAQALRDEDPTFATTVSVIRLRRHGVIFEGLGFLIGWVVLLAGVGATQALLGFCVTFSLAGFLTGTGGMLAIALVLFGRPRTHERIDPDRRPERSGR